MPNLNLADALRQAPNFEKLLLETFQEYERMRVDMEPDDFDEDTLTRLLCERIEAERTWYKVTGPVVTMDFGE